MSDEHALALIGLIVIVLYIGAVLGVLIETIRRSNMSTKEEIITVRKSTNVPPHRQIVGKLGRWYRSPEEQHQDAQDLQQAIQEAREARLAVERTKH